MGKEAIIKCLLKVVPDRVKGKSWSFTEDDRFAEQIVSRLMDFPLQVRHCVKLDKWIHTRVSVPTSLIINLSTEPTSGRP